MAPQGAVCVSILVPLLLVLFSFFHLPHHTVMECSARRKAPRPLPTIVRAVRPELFGGLSLGGCA